MSYSNGLGNLQNLLSNLGSIKPQNTSATDKTEASAKSVSSTASAGHNQGSQISTTSSLLSKAISGSDVRTEKVAALQQTIADGTYNVSSGDVASSIIASLLG